jgi:hypothetical protein
VVLHEREVEHGVETVDEAKERSECLIAKARQLMIDSTERD